MNEHLPTPWKWDDNADGFEGWLMILTEQGKPVASLGDMAETSGVDLANADFIVEAVNNYPALVAAARVVVERWERAELKGYHLDALAARLPDAGAGGNKEETNDGGSHG